MRKLFFIFLILLLSANNFAQSRRVNPAAQNPANLATNAMNELTLKQMFDEANTFAKTKFAEFQTKKIPFSDALYKRTLLERKQLAAKYATVARARQNLAGEDFYYLGMLYWIIENTEVSAEFLRKFLAGDNPAIEKLQQARPILIVEAARRMVAK